MDRFLSSPNSDKPKLNPVVTCLNNSLESKKPKQMKTVEFGSIILFPVVLSHTGINPIINNICCVTI